MGRHMEEVAFAVVSTPYVEWDFYSGTTASSMQTTSRVPTALDDDYTAHSNIGNCFPPQSLGLSKLEDEGPTSIEIDPCVAGLKGVELAERHEPMGEWSPGDFLDSQGIFKCRSLNPATGRNCNITYSHRKDFVRHEAIVHYAKEHEKPKLRCSFCSTEEVFLRKSSLTRHMKSTHPGIPWSIRPSQCPVCRTDNEQFKQDAMLALHMADSHPDITWPHPTPLRYSRLALSRGLRNQAMTRPNADGIGM